MTIEDKIAALEQALATGERRVKFPDGREMEYRDVDQITSAIAYLRAQLPAAGGSVTYTSFSRE